MEVEGSKIVEEEGKIVVEEKEEEGKLISGLKRGKNVICSCWRNH